VPRFLSPEWIQALDAAASGAAVPGDARLTLQQIVTGDEGKPNIQYHLVVADGRLRVLAGEAAAPDVTLIQSREVAVALSRGEVNAQHALAAGRLKLRGHLELLLRQAPALTALDDVFAAVRAQTTY
jgi:putative sterol carrier protein